jgi:hypothetical protein
MPQRQKMALRHVCLVGGRKGVTVVVRGRAMVRLLKLILNLGGRPGNARSGGEGRK